MNRYPHKSRGAALVVGLLLLVIVTLLAVTGMTTANTELVMAGNEQQRLNAFRAASAGVEQAITEVWDVPTIPGHCERREPAEVPESPADHFETATAYVGEGHMLPRFGTRAASGLHYSIRSRGSSARGARAEQMQGMLTLSLNPDSSFVVTPLGADATAAAVEACVPEEID
jgi:type IV pilus assembly protein PilX